MTPPDPGGRIAPSEDWQARAEAAEAEIARLRSAAADIFRGFVSESLNGVVCSIPDSGIYTPHHRTWCARCQRLWLGLKTLGDPPVSASSGPTNPDRTEA